ncbi:MAG: sigma 54-interacting transcriptional regulator [Myxococcales bacterium]|nr:sigma 54-interacting transcriptional regulator [Myxococcales bacterium]
MSSSERTLVCWHSERAGFEVLEHTIAALRRHRLPPTRVVYLLQKRQGMLRELPSETHGVPIEVCVLELEDPTHHDAIYDLLRREVCPRLTGELHVNVSPGTPAMHAVWLVLAAAGALPPGAKLWSSQFNPETKRTRLDPVRFAPSTYLREIRQSARTEPERARYEPEPRSVARRQAFERLARFAAVAGAPLLILGERGTGKTRLVETLVATLKRRPRVTTLACGGLDSTLADSLLFGHRKGAFTGAETERAGLLAEARGGVLFLDEVQDLPALAQRKLVRVLQDRRRAYRPLGVDEERTTDFELVCASNLPIEALRGRLDADLFDRVSHLSVSVPPLRSCRDDLREDWEAVWREMRVDVALTAAAPWSAAMARVLNKHPLPGNLRDLQRLAALLCAWLPDSSFDDAIERSLEDWERVVVETPVPLEESVLGTGTREERVREFRAHLAAWARSRWGTWAAAARALACDEKTLREDARGAHVRK